MDHTERDRLEEVIPIDQETPERLTDEDVARVAEVATELGLSCSYEDACERLEAFDLIYDLVSTYGEAGALERAAHLVSVYGEARVLRWVVNAGRFQRGGE